MPEPDVTTTVFVPGPSTQQPMPTGHLVIAHPFHMIVTVPAEVELKRNYRILYGPVFMQGYRVIQVEGFTLTPNRPGFRDVLVNVIPEQSNGDELRIDQTVHGV